MSRFLNLEDFDKIFAVIFATIPNLHHRQVFTSDYLDYDHIAGIYTNLERILLTERRYDLLEMLDGAMIGKMRKTKITDLLQFPKS